MQRHPHGLTERILGRALARYQKTVDQLPTHPSLSTTVLEVAIRDGVGLAAVASLGDEADPRILQGLRASARAGGALYAGLSASAPVSVSLDGSSLREVGPFDADDNTNPISWRRAFFSAICAGDHRALAHLRGADLAGIRRSPTTSGPFAYAQIEALIGLDAPGARERLLAALKLADPEAVEPGYRDFVLDVVCHELELFFRVLAGDAAAFDTALAKAVAGHRRYYGRGEPARTPLGQLALGPLAAVCLARGRGMEVTVRSGYLPPSVSGRNFSGLWP